ncbi:MAG: polysaccharide ABC transporter ATP-binding protein [Chitinophagales bacterium]
MADTIIKVEDLSKQYRLGEIGTGSLSHDLNRWWYKIRGKEDPYLKIGETNDRTQKGNSDYVWALRDINFEIKRGETWGVIGKNGAGKSTLLKLLSKITAPSTGVIKINGKMASLLEVGTGFHGELTGRENIFLNGAILGMKRKEIASKLDEIIAFAGVEKYIDTPVKRYSSGMYVRLAFAVAAHLDTDILILDEVLAVGDASFQRKCLGKMNDAATNHGKTVLFVSHNLSQVQGLCKYGMLLENGVLKTTGNINKVVGEYVLGNQQSTHIDVSQIPRVGPKSTDFFIRKLTFLSDVSNIYENEEIEFEIEFDCTASIQELVLGFSIKDTLDAALIECRSTSSIPTINIQKPGTYTITTKLNPKLAAGIYVLNIGARCLNGPLEYVPSVTNLEILPNNKEEIEEWNKPSAGIMLMPSIWTLK